MLLELIRTPTDKCGETMEYGTWDKRAGLGSRIMGGFDCAVTCVFTVADLVLIQKS